MQHSEIINKIVEAEHHASQIAGEAKQKRDGLSREIEREVAAMRALYEEKIKRRLELVGNNENQIAAEREAELDRELAADLERIKQKYAHNHSVWAKQMFDMIVGHGNAG